MVCSTGFFDASCGSCPAFKRLYSNFGLKQKRNWELSPLPDNGFIRVVEAHITPKRLQKISDDEWQKFALELETKLEEASNKLIPIRVKINFFN